MLIAIECHARGITPTYMAGFRAFLNLNRCVGEMAIHILAFAPLAAAAVTAATLLLWIGL